MDLSRARFLGAGMRLAALGSTLLTTFLAAAMAEESDTETFNSLAHSSAPQSKRIRTAPERAR
jgi:hypothetical protein